MPENSNKVSLQKVPPAGMERRLELLERHAAKVSADFDTVKGSLAANTSMTKEVAHLRLAGAFIEHMDWHKLMERYDRPHTLFYLDPPYWETEGYGVDFGLDEYVKMAKLMGRLKGKAVLSLNDHPEIRRIFAAFQMDTVPITYTVGGGGKEVERGELIIYSWDRTADPVGLF